MANWDEINNALSTRLNDNWVTTPIAWDNVPYDPTPNQEWVRAAMIPTVTENAALADATRRQGIYAIQIFTPLNRGSGRAYELADMLSAIFSNQQFSNVVCYAAETTRIGDEGNGWYEVVLQINFWSQERN